MYSYLWHCFRCNVERFLLNFLSWLWARPSDILVLLLLYTIPTDLTGRQRQWLKRKLHYNTDVLLCLWGIWVGWHITLKIYFEKRKNEKCLNPSEMKGCFFFDLWSFGDRLWVPETVRGRNCSNLGKVNHICLSSTNSKLLSTHIFVEPKFHFLSPTWESREYSTGSSSFTATWQHAHFQNGTFEGQCWPYSKVLLLPWYRLMLDNLISMFF